jgi:MFS family permease
MSPIAYAITGGLSMSCSLLISPLVTHLIHLYGNRTMLNFGILLQTISFLAASFSTRNWHIFLSQGVCFGCGMGFIFIASVNIVPQWFLRRRSLAMSLAAAGSGLGGMAFSLGTGAMIPSLGLAWTFRALGLITCVLNLVSANLMRDRNLAVGSLYRAFNLSLLKRPEFLLLLGWGAFSLLGYVVLLFSLPNFALTIGLTPHQGSIIMALMNLGQGLGRPVVGVISDRYGRITMGGIFTLICGVFCFAIWIPALNMGVACFFAVIVGTVAGTYWTTIVPICAEVIGMQQLPGGLSITWLAMVVPTTIAEAIGVALKNDAFGKRTYLHSQIFAGIVYILAGSCLWILRGWKVGENERIAKEKSMISLTHTVRSENDGPISTEDDKGWERRDTDEPVPSPPYTPSMEVGASPWSPKHLLGRMVALKLV